LEGSKPIGLIENPSTKDTCIWNISKMLRILAWDQDLAGLKELSPAEIYQGQEKSIKILVDSIYSKINKRIKKIR